MKAVTVKLDHELVNRIRKEAFFKRIKVSEFVRDCILYAMRDCKEKKSVDSQAYWLKKN